MNKSKDTFNIESPELENYLLEYLYDETDCISIEEARKKAEEKWPE